MADQTCASMPALPLSRGTQTRDAEAISRLEQKAAEARRDAQAIIAPYRRQMMLECAYAYEKIADAYRKLNPPRQNG